jgi:hypothetical protein
VHRTIEAVAESLLNWAQANSEASINLPSKPHAIIVLNRSEADSDLSYWHSVNSTDELLNFSITKAKSSGNIARMVSPT